VARRGPRVGLKAGTAAGLAAATWTERQKSETAPGWPGPASGVQNCGALREVCQKWRISTARRDAGTLDKQFDVIEKVVRKLLCGFGMTFPRPFENLFQIG
jgi:hypothetical protein